MRRKPALAIAASAALIGSASVLAIAAVTGSGVLGFHLGHVGAVSVATTTASTEPPTSAETTEDPEVTLPPVIVQQTEFVDQYVTVTTGRRAAAADPAAAEPALVADASPRTGTVAPAAPPATPAPTVATTQATTAVTQATTEATDPPTTAPPPPPPSTVFDRSKYPFKITLPANWGTKTVPPLPTPVAGKQWSECELHDAGFWECQYP